MAKEEWPELVGKTGPEAKAIIQQDRPELTEIQVLPADSMVTCDYRTDRVRIFTTGGKVASTPRVG